MRQCGCRLQPQLRTEARQTSNSGVHKHKQNYVDLYNNCIERRCLELNLTPQEDEQWNEDSAIDINDEDLTKSDDNKESEEHTSNDINIVEKTSYLTPNT